MKYMHCAIQLPKNFGSISTKNGKIVTSHTDINTFMGHDGKISWISGFHWYKTENIGHTKAAPISFLY